MEVLVEIIVFSIVFLLGFRLYGLANVKLNRVKSDMDEFIDLVMGVDFMRDEVLTKIRSDGFTASSTSFISFRGYSSGRLRTITYRVSFKKGEYRIYRHADGEGNNVILRSKDEIWFEPSRRMVIIHVGDLIFHLHEPRGPTPRPSIPLEVY